MEFSIYRWDAHRHDLPYETDGVVVKVSSHYQDELDLRLNPHAGNGL
jgi:NAD-dependent DNA ligase